jgi:hypothetical protein
MNDAQRKIVERLLDYRRISGEEAEALRALLAAKADARDPVPCSQHRTYERHCALCNGATTP